jgi:hypothetical protein
VRRPQLAEDDHEKPPQRPQNAAKRWQCVDVDLPYESGALAN